jgi:hypothetical protein
MQAVWHRMKTYHTIYTKKKWSSQENEQNVDGQGKEHAQWCWNCTIILGRGN